MTFTAPATLTDLYQLTMLQGYFTERMEETAVFEFFVRRLPAQRNFLVAAGLEQVLEFVQQFQFTTMELDWLRTTNRFGSDFLNYLERLRFTGDVDAMPEGTLFFANEPILRVAAPISEAQIVETRIINLLQYQTLVASKAARCVLAAPGKRLVDFGLRRAHGAEAGLLAARACYLAGFSATSNVFAGQVFGIPISGTMAHSFVQSFASEDQAFLAFARANRNDVVFLIDTYDTEVAAAKVVALAPKLQAEDITIRAVRLDSGNLADHALRVREILDAGGLREVRIFASGNIDEHQLDRLARANAPIDGFGVGTRVLTSADAPYLDCAYKLQEYAGTARRKRSEGKETWPGRKQVYREFGGDGRLLRDTITLIDSPPLGRPLLEPVMRAGRRITSPPSLDDICKAAARNLAELPEAMRRLDHYEYQVRVSDELKNLAQSLDAMALTVAPPDSHGGVSKKR